MAGDEGPSDEREGSVALEESATGVERRDSDADGRRLPAVFTSIAFPVLVFVVWRLVAGLVAAQAFDQSFIGSHYRWDSGNYLTILDKGYFDPLPTQPETAFFPFVSWVGKVLDVFLPGTCISPLRGPSPGCWSGVVVGNVAALGAFVAVWGAARAWRGAAVARWSVVLLALFPASFFLWSFYSEAAFVALSAGAVWADRRHRHVVAAGLLLLTATTRTIGMLVAGVLVLARVVRERRIDAVTLLYAGSAAAGVSLVMGQMWYQNDDPLSWLKAQDDWGRKLTWPWVAVERGWLVIGDQYDPTPPPGSFPSVPQQTTNNEFKARVLDFASVWLVLGAALYAAWPRKRRQDRWPNEAWLLIVGLTLLPLASGLLYSFGRFTLATWPIFVVYGEIGHRLVARWRSAWVPVLVAAAALGVAWYQYLGHWMRGNFLG